jgi:hypothetical protein
MIDSETPGMSRRDLLAAAGAVLAWPELAAAQPGDYFGAVQVVGAEGIFRIAAACNGESGKRIVAELVGLPPVPIRHEQGGALAWQSCTPQSANPFDVLASLGDPSTTLPGTSQSAQGCVELDLRSLPAVADAPHGVSQALALRDLSEGLNAGPWYWVDFEDLRGIFGAPDRRGGVHGAVGSGDDPVASAVHRAAGAAATPAWSGAASAFVTTVFASGEHRLRESSRAFRLVRDWMHPGAHCAYTACESRSVPPGSVRVTVHAFHTASLPDDQRGNV